MIARVLVDVPSKAVDKLFDYIVPPLFESVLEIGMRLIVPFGHRELMGYCLEITNISEYEHELKPIIRLLDMESYLTKELIELAKIIQIDTSTVLIKVLETMLPSALKAIYRTKFQVISYDKLPLKLQSIFENSHIKYLNEEFNEALKEVKEAIFSGALKQIYDISSKSNPRYKKFVKLQDLNYSLSSEKHLKVVEYLKDKQEQKIEVNALLTKLQLTSSVLKTLEKYKVISIYSSEEYREIESIQENYNKEVTLNLEQEAAFQKIVLSLNESKTFLLHGITGSGKTEIYLKAIEEVLKRKKEVIFLVPEIALTPMMVNRFKGRFKNQVAILHSGLSVGEKYDEWRKIIRQEVSIVIGARSACFAPFTNLGLLVVDECHESTYKQDDMPKYYAIDVLNHRAKYYNIPVILGSATPSIESYARYKRGYYELLPLKNRAMNSFEPDLKVIDMKEEFKKGNQSLFSLELQEEIKIRLDKKEQVILLLNRRGYSTFVICRNCGHVFTCPNCDISLTYHETDHSLKCHYCGHKAELPKVCPKCGKEDLRYMGSGTQKIESELSSLFPNAKIIRMDNDTTRTKNAHEKLLVSFEMQGDILLGTQMIAKGLDFPKVTLVGIIQADSNLYSPDFRAPEKTFQLITQVSGRAGRHDLKGKVLVQAFNPNHYAIQYAIHDDYLGFYEYEMSLRKLAKYVPFYFLVQVLLTGEFIRDLFIAGKEIVRNLRTHLSNEAIVLGPALPLIAKIKNRYSCQIVIKYKKEPNLDLLLFETKEKYDTDTIFVSIDKSPTLG
ncbi:MAG: primosomal protein N' [Firmicutes bacterium]|nr:primosomal protein N' [Bacillota bacterium]